MSVSSKQAFELIFGQYGMNDAAIKIWEAAVNWERRECEDIAKRYKQRNKDHVTKKTAAESIINSIQRRNKNDRAI
jgi:hypothetical protein